MTKIKKAMSAERRHDVVPTVVEIVDGDNMSSASLARILKKAELDISFMSPVHLNSVGDIMEMYDGRDVYVQENGETSNPVFYHGRLEIDVMSQMKYSIKTEGVSRHVDKRYFSRVRRLIVMRKEIM
jgi:hypothetical protein